MRFKRQLVWLLWFGLGVGFVDEALPETLATVTERAEARGLRVREVRWDAVLQQRWAVLEDAAHPGRPLIAELTDVGLSAGIGAAAEPDQVLSQATVQPVELAVHYGDRVVLWRAEQNVRMQMAAIAEGNAPVGGRVQLRVTGAGVSGDAGWRVTGVVRGQRSVEMEQ